MDRSKSFKKGVSQDDSRRRREANAIAIRKDKKEEGLAKRRNIVATDGDDDDAGAGTAENPLHPGSKQVYTLADIPALFAGLQSADPEAQLECLRGFRRLLSLEKHAPIRETVESGAMPLFVQFLARVDSPDLQFEAAWVLTNVASSDMTKVVVDYDAVPLLVQLLMHANADIREQCAWCLGNIAGDSSALRDVVLQHGAIASIARNIENPASLSLLRNCTWTMSNLCRGKPAAPLSLVAPALPVLAGILAQNADTEAMIDAMWALSYVSDGENARIQAVIDAGVVPMLARILGCDKSTAVTPALRTLGNIVSGDGHQTKAVVEAGVLPMLVGLMTNSKKTIRKEACWLLSNVAADSPELISAVAATPSLLPRVLEQVSSGEWEVRKEATHVVCNMVTIGTAAHIAHLVEHHAIREICTLLDTGDVKMVLLVMEALEAILKAGSHGNVDYKTLVDEAGGIDALESLQEHENCEVYTKATLMLETFFEAEDENENITPTVVTDAATGNSVFSFGLPGGAGHDKAMQFSLGEPSGRVPVFNGTFQF